MNQEVPFAEMGDIQPALENLLALQSRYARREVGVTRANVDVARKALIAEIRQYVEQCLNPYPNSALPPLMRLIPQRELIETFEAQVGTIWNLPPEMNGPVLDSLPRTWRPMTDDVKRAVEKLDRANEAGSASEKKPNAPVNILPGIMSPIPFKDPE